MKYLKFVLLFLILFYSCAYPDRDPAPDSTVFFVNNSDKSLLEYSVTNYYPDTLICTDGNPFARLVKLFVIEPYFTSKRGTCWRSYLSKSSIGVMTIFLFDKAVVDTVPWDKIREDYLVAKRYEYTLEQLDSLNWTITYP